MTTELQEQFKNYVFENVKENLYRIYKDMPRYHAYGDAKDNREHNQYLRNTLLDLRKDFSRNVAQGVPLIQICPSLKSLYYKLWRFIEDEVKKIKDEITEEFKPMAIHWVRQDEELVKHLKNEFRRETTIISSTDTPINFIIFRLSHWLKDKYEEIPGEFLPDFYTVAKAIVYGHFTLSLALKEDISEEVKKVA